MVTPFFGDKLIFDINEDAVRILCLGDSEMLKLMFSSDAVFADGTFFACPKIVQQIFILSILVKNTLIPCAYILMSDSKKTSYSKVFNKLNNLANEYDLNFCPREIKVDFEISLINALKQCLPNTKISGCFFPFFASYYS